MKVVMSDGARDDLRGIGLRIAADNPSRAASFTRELGKAAKGLSHNPRRFPLAVGLEGFQIRRRVHGNYLIFYRVEPTQIAVLRILHGARDYLSLLDA